MLTAKHICLLSISALSLAAVTPALAGPGVDVMLKGNSPTIGDPGITFVAKKANCPPGKHWTPGYCPAGLILLPNGTCINKPKKR